MRLEDLSPAHVRRAVDLYLQVAYPPACGKQAPMDSAQLGSASTLEQVLARFETPRSAMGAPAVRRFALRLGNWRYPHMKLVMQEYLVAGEFFFSVDTHDNLDVRPGMPDYSQFQELRAFNRSLKDQIEAAFERDGLPTHGQLRALCEDLGHLERETGKQARILLVDDERQVALGLSALLRGRGYEVEVVHSAEDVIASLERAPLPDLLLLDLELPRLGGRDLLDVVRMHPRWKKLRVVMATASEMDLSSLGRMSGYLKKPYTRDVLLAFLERVLGAGGRP
jgi:CheY-like chemotaxis protein